MSMRAARRPRSPARAGHRPLHGFTLVELLVVIAIIATLVGLLMPAVQMARGSARRAQCMNNMKQLGLAVTSFESQMGTLPSQFGLSPLNGIGQPWGTWVMHIMPHIEMQSVYDQLPRNQYEIVLSTTTISGMFCEVAAPQNSAVATATYSTGGGDASKTIHSLAPSLPAAQCPGDPVQTQRIVWQYGKEWLLTNYFTNAWVFIRSMGKNDTRSLSTSSSYCGVAYNTANRWDRRSWLGTFAWHTYEMPLKFANIRDGLSNTILLAEGMRQVNEDRRRCNGAWSSCGTGYRESYRMAFWGSMVDQNDKNMINHTHNFGWLTWPAAPAPQSGYAHTLMFQETPSLEMADPWRMQAMHGSALVVAMCDGSVRTISNSVSRREASSPDGPAGGVNFGCDRPDGVWDLLMLPNDGKAISEGDF